MGEQSGPIFIVGCSRSGTTLLRLILNQEHSLHIPHESEFFIELRDRCDAYGDFSEPHQRWFFIRDLQTTEVSMNLYSFSIFDLEVKEAEQAIATAAPTDFAGAAAALFTAAAQKKGKSRWGDKTPHYVRHIDWLAEAFPDSQFIHMIRDGRAVTCSRMDAGFTANARRAAAHWKQEIRTGRRAGQALPSTRYTELFYEDLVHSPRRELRALCDWAGLSYSDELLDFHQDSDEKIPDEHDHLHENTKNPIDPSRAHAWKHSLSDRHIADIEDVSGDLLRDLGYDMTGLRPPLWLQSVRWMSNQTKPLVYEAIEKAEKYELV